MLGLIGLLTGAGAVYFTRKSSKLRQENLNTAERLANLIQ
jgi:hypothetical protein